MEHNKLQKGRTHIVSRNEGLHVSVHHWIYFSFSFYEENRTLLLVAFKSNYI